MRHRQHGHRLPYRRGGRDEFVQRARNILSWFEPLKPYAIDEPLFKLEDANYVVCTKSFAGRVPRTEYRITSAGRKALEQYLDHMEQIIQQTRGN